MNSDNLNDRIREIESENISDKEKKLKMKKLIDEFAKGKNKKNNEVLYLTIAFLIIGVAIMLFSFATGNYIALMLLFVLAFIFPLIGNVVNVKRRYRILTADKSESSHLQSLCKDIYSEVDSNIINRERIILGILYVFAFLGIISFLILTIMIITEKGFNTKEGIISIIILGITSIIGLSSYCFIPSRKKKYSTWYKKEIVEKFIKTTSDYEYNSALKRSVLDYENEYRTLIFDNKTFNKMELEDYISGNINHEHSFEMFDLYAYYYEVHYNRGHKNEKRTEAFKGNYTIINISKQFPNIRILQNKINVFDKNELINTDNQKFNKYFEIHAQDKDTVQSYLTPSLIDFLADFREKYKIDFEIIFKDKIYIRFFTGNMFEPKIFGKIIDEISIYKYYVITKFAKELVERIDNYC